jgi:peptidoglycan/LPS O-acetylase OafA/YrhL
MRQTQLDGVRGVAVLLVIAYHHYIISWGWIGVDIFFVLSGFLITRVLLGTKDRGHYWSVFYIKRMSRIFPPLLILFPVTLILSRHTPFLGVLGYVFFLGNYMDTTRFAVPLFVMLWSLAIEEHFYLIWPTAVKILSDRRILQILSAILILEPILRMAVTHSVNSYEPIYYHTWFRLDSIAAGSLLALLASRSAVVEHLAKYALPLCAAAVATSIALFWFYRGVFTRSANTLLFNGIGYSLMTTASFFLVAHLVFKETGWLARLLSVRPLVFIGKISYGMYLFHGIVLAIMRRLMNVGVGPLSADGTKKLFWIDLPLVICISWLSFVLIESHVIEWSKRRTRSIQGGFYGAEEAKSVPVLP